MTNVVTEKKRPIDPVPMTKNGVVFIGYAEDPESIQLKIPFSSMADASVFARGYNYMAKKMLQDKRTPEIHQLEEIRVSSQYEHRGASFAFRVVVYCLKHGLDFRRMVPATVFGKIPRDRDAGG